MLTSAITIYFQAHARSAGFSLYTYVPQEFYPLDDPKHLVYHHDPKSGCPTSVMKVTINNVTQGIAFINTRPQGYTSTCPNDNTMYTGIEICEVKVMGQFCINAKILIFRGVFFHVFIHLFYPLSCSSYTCIRKGEIKTITF